MSPTSAPILSASLQCNSFSDGISPIPCSSHPLSLRLGDFTKLHNIELAGSLNSQASLLARTSLPYSSADVSSSPDSIKLPKKLGNFNKIFTRFQVPRSDTDRNSSPLSKARESKTGDNRPSHDAQHATTGWPSTLDVYDTDLSLESTGFPIQPRNTATEIVPKTREAQYTENGTFSSGTDSDSESEPSTDTTSTFLTPASTPPSLIETAISFSSRAPGRKLSRSHRPASAPWLRKRRSENSSQLVWLFSFHSTVNGTSGHVHEPLRSHDEKHESIMTELIPHCSLDMLLSQKYPIVTSKGIHVFVDMSNIDIGFQNSIRKRHSLSDCVHFSPLPHINLQLLTNILVRDRPTVALNVGCSQVPGRQEPRYVRELRKLGYQVDLRERKRIEYAETGSPAVRYVEDLVDETLQTRMAESVMEYFQEQGTIVLVTGDAKPAQYSHGFFTYAERALKMGWNVEVVSWRSSLSSSWTNPTWMSQWGDKFRIIELDQFLDDLITT